MRLLPVLAASCFISSMSMRIVDPVVPEMARDLGVTAAVVAMLASAFTFPYALGQPVLGSLGDALGKARIIKISLAVLMLSLVVCAVAPSLSIIYAARIIGGAAAGGIIPLAFAMVGDRFAFDQRQVALSRLLTAIIAGQLTGSIGSGLVSDFAGWRWTMGGSALLALAALVLTLRALQPRTAVIRQPVSVKATARAYRDVFQNRRSWVCLPAVFVEGVVIFGLFPYIAVLLEERGAGGIREAGFVLAGFGIGGLIYTAFVAAVLPRLGVYRLMASGAGITGLALASLSLAETWPEDWAIFVAIGSGFYMIHNSLQTFATELSTRNRGAGVAAHAFFFFVGQATGPVVYGLLFAAIGATSTLILTGLVFALAGWATSAALRMIDETAPRRP